MGKRSKQKAAQWAASSRVWEQREVELREGQQAKVAGSSFVKPPDPPSPPRRPELAPTHRLVPTRDRELERQLRRSEREESFRRERYYARRRAQMSLGALGRRRADLDAHIRDKVEEARMYGVSWTIIGDALGERPDTVRKRYTPGLPLSLRKPRTQAERLEALDRQAARLRAAVAARDTDDDPEMDLEDF